MSTYKGQLVDRLLVRDLKAALQELGQPTNGLKTVLVSRLKAYLEANPQYTLADESAGEPSQPPEMDIDEPAKEPEEEEEEEEEEQEPAVEEKNEPALKVKESKVAEKKEPEVPKVTEPVAKPRKLERQQKPEEKSAPPHIVETHEKEVSAKPADEPRSEQKKSGSLRMDVEAEKQSNITDMERDNQFTKEPEELQVSDDASDKPEPESMIVERTHEAPSQQPRKRSATPPRSPPSKKARVEPDRVVPPSDIPATRFVRVAGLVRPYPQPQLKRMIEEFGSVDTFWVNGIKSVAAVKFDQVSAAEACRNGLHNLRWPELSKSTLSVDFLTEDEFEAVTSDRELPPRQSAASSQSSDPAPATSSEATPAAPEENATNEGYSLDKYFKRTKTEPHLYYLPLTDVQVALKNKNH